MDRTLGMAQVQRERLVMGLLVVLAAGHSAHAAESRLKLVLSLEENVVTHPYPARVTLHFLNSGSETVWLYRRARHEGGLGPSLEVRLSPIESTIGDSPARGRTLDYVGMPRPKLFRLAPGEDYTEKAALKLTPAQGGSEGGEPLWGRYRLDVIYRASYPNADTFQRITRATLWQGEVESNAVEIELRLPAADGLISGVVSGPEGLPLHDALVSLADDSDRLIDQVRTGPDGRYLFGDLSPGKYWVTVRRPMISEDTTVFRHVIVTAEEPEGTLDFQLPRREIYEAKVLLHKPVLVRVTDRNGRELENATLEIVYSTGTVVEKIREQTGSDGLAALELIPGRNFVTVKRRQCRKYEQRLDVEAGAGVDAFHLQIECR